MRYEGGDPLSKHLPNALTCLRIMLVPVFVLLYFFSMRTLALAVFVVAEITDVLDGSLARRLRCTSDLGKVLDPLADKLTLMGILLCLYISHRVPAWLMLLLTARELSMIFAGIVLWRRRLTFGADIFGKFTSALCFTAAVLLFPWHSHPALLRIGSVLLQCALVCSVITSLHYARLWHMTSN